MKSTITKNQDGTMRALSNRHVQMIAIGGTIGIGLFWDPEVQLVKPARP